MPEESTHPDTLTAVLDFLHQHAPFAQMASEHLQWMAQRLRLVSYAAGTVISQPDSGPADSFYIIKQGQIEGESKEGDKSAWVLTNGECFPLGALLAQRPVNTCHRAATDTSCYLLDVRDFQQLLSMSPLFHDFCTRRIANLLDQTQREHQARAAQSMAEDQLLNTALKDLLKANAPFCHPNDSIESVLETMENYKARSIAIVHEDGSIAGLFTLRDVLKRVTLARQSLSQPISSVMSKDPISLNENAFSFEAALLMAEKGFGHICVNDDNGRYRGIVSERMLFSLQKVGLGNVSQAISRANDIASLKNIVVDIHHLSLQMIAQGISSEQLTELLTTLNDKLTIRIIELTLAKQISALPEFIWLSFGSEGRREQTLVTDQDNGMLFNANSPEEAEQIRQQLLPVAKEINQALDQIGFPLCKGNIMASNPDCCLSLDEWKQRFANWIRQGTPENLLKASIFFDFRSIYGGNYEWVKSLRNDLLHLSQHYSRFLGLMAANALSNQAPLGLLNQFKTHTDKHGRATIDLKINGITPVVDCARIFALANDINATNTLKRLTQLADIGKLNSVDVENWQQAWHFIQMLRIRNHQRAIQKNEIPNNLLVINSLNELESRILKESFRQVRKLQRKLAMEYQI